MKKKNKFNISDLDSSFGNGRKHKDSGRRADNHKNYYGESEQWQGFGEKFKKIFSKENKNAAQNLVIVCGVVMLIVLSCVAINRVDSQMSLGEQKTAAKGYLAGNEQAAAVAGENKNKEEEGTGNDTLNNDNDYFINYAMEKEKVRAEQLELLNEMTDNQNALQEVKEEAENKILAITEDMENELLLESLLVAKYGGEAVVFVQEDKVNVILRPQGVEMDNNEADKIAQLVDTYTDIGYENAIIVIKD